MAQINVTQFAKDLGLPIELLIEQLQTAGVKKNLADDTVLTEKDKTQLLDYLREAHGAKEAKNKITLTRKQTTEIKKADATGKARTIQVEVRKKRVLVKRDAVAEAAPAEAPTPAPVIDAEQLAKRGAEAKRQAELIAIQSEEAQQKQSRARRKKADAEAGEAVAVKATPATTPEAPVAETKLAAAALTEGTLHKPQPKPGDKPKAEKKAKKPVKEVIW